MSKGTKTNMNQGTLSSSSTKTKKTRKRRKVNSFLGCQTITQVLDFPSLVEPSDSNKRICGIVAQPHKTISSHVVSEITKEVFLDRLVKEIVSRFSPSRTPRRLENNQKEHEGSQSKEQTGSRRSIWSQRVVMGTNQCLRVLESAMKESMESATKKIIVSGNPSIPILCVCARDIYPPTMLVHVPIIVKRLDIPYLLLPGKASEDLGKALGVKKTSILLFMPSLGESEENKAMNSFCDYAVKLLSTDLASALPSKLDSK